MPSRLFAPWFLTGDLTPKRAEPVRERLLATMRARPFPLHVNVLWNALFWEWSEESRTYEHMTGTDLIEERSPKAIDAPLPIGAFVQLKPGQQLIWGEVIYKEREVPPSAPEVCAWELAPGFLDIPADGILTERLVLDFDTALMPDQQALIAREIPRRRMLDEFGHLVLRSRYGPDDAILDDGAFFVEYLLRRHGPALVREFSRSDLSEESARGALLQSLQVVRDVLANTPGLRSWGEYWFTREAHDAEPALLDGVDRLSSIRSAVMHLPASQHVGYHAVSLALRNHYLRGSHAPEERALLSQTGYAGRIVHANAYLRDQAADADKTRSEVAGLKEEADFQQVWHDLFAKASALTSRGPVVMRRSIDAVQRRADRLAAAAGARPVSAYLIREVGRRISGGVWRSERTTTASAPAYAQLPPDLELPYGHTPDHDLRARAGHLMAAAPPTSAEGRVSFKAKRRGFESPLSARDIDEGRLRVDRAVELFGSDVVAFQLVVPRVGRILASTPAATLDRERRVLSGIDWSDEVYPGLLICGTVQQDSRRLDCWVNVLTKPVAVDGAAEPLPWEFDESVWRDALRASRNLPRDVISRSVSPADLLAAAFGRVGARDEMGRLVASLPDLYAAIAQSVPNAPTDLDFAEMLLRLLIDTPLVAELPDGRFAYAPNIAKGVSSQDPTTLAAWRDTESGRKLRAAVYTADAWEQPFYIRRWNYKNIASWERQRLTFRAAAVRDGAPFKYQHMDLPERWSYTRKAVHRRRAKANQREVTPE